jgi:hypothetical protein
MMWSGFAVFRRSAYPARVTSLAPIGQREMICSPGQIIRTLVLFALVCAGLMVATVHARAQEAAPVSDAQFRTFVTNLWPDARKAGVSRATFDAALGKLTPDASVIKITGKQSEFVKPIWHYIGSAVSPQRLERGEARAKEFEKTLARIESKYGVDRYVVLAVWGMETNYGGFSGKMNVVRSLATLAASGYRGTFFRDELIVALFIASPDQFTLPRQMYAGIREFLSPTIAAAAVLIILMSVVLLMINETIRKRAIRHTVPPTVRTQ